MTDMICIHTYIYIYICSVYMHRHTYIYIYVLRIYLDLLHHKLNKIVSTYRSYILYIKYDCIYHILLCIRYCFMYYTIYKKKNYELYITHYILQIKYHIIYVAPCQKDPSSTRHHLIPQAGPVHQRIMRDLEPLLRDPCSPWQIPSKKTFF